MPIAAGPMTTMNSVGRMQKISGKRIFTGTFCADSSARWDRFVRPDEMAQWMSRTGLRPKSPAGMVFNPLRNEWSLGRDTDVNYILAASLKSTT